MTNFLKKRFQAIFVFLAVTLVVAIAIRLSGDPAQMLTHGSGSFWLL